MIKNFKNNVQWTHLIKYSNGEQIIGTFYEKNCKRQIKNVKNEAVRLIVK